MSLDAHDPLRRYAESVHSYVRALPSALDTKVAVFAAAMMGALIFTLDRFARRTPNAPLERGDWMLVLGACMIVLALGLSIVSLLARMTGNKRDLFSVVALVERTTAETVVRELKEQTPDQLIEQQLRHCHELARIAMVKSKWFNGGAYVGLAGVVLVALGVLS